MTLPSSYDASGGLVRVGDHPIADGGFSDVWEGNHRGRKVCIKCLRVSVKNSKEVTKVRIRYRHGPSASSTEEHLLCAPVILQRGYFVEKVKTSKCCSVHWCCNETSTIFVGVYAKWNSDRVCREKSGRRSDRAGESFLNIRVYWMTDNVTFPSY